MAGKMVEWNVPGSDEKVPGYLSLPENTPAPGVIVIQEFWGLEPHIRDVANRFAKAGYAAIAPDLYHGEIATEPDEARKLMMELEYDHAIEEIEAAGNYLLSLDQVSGDKVGVVGFCMGGALSLLMACRKDITAASVVFYGRNPDPIEQVGDLKCPLLGIYGEADAGIPPAEVERLKQALDAAGKTNYEFMNYPGAPHAFFNDRRQSYRPEESADAWERTLHFFNQHLG